MIDLFGHRDSGPTHCDGVSRRDFLKVGGMAAGGLSLGQLLEVEAAQKTGRSHKAVINIYLPGGPSHLDFFDLKPEAGKEIRGEFRPIKTNVPGVEICEMFPRLAKMADQYSIIRSLADSDGAHDCFQCMTGRRQSEKRNAPQGGWPSWGSWVSKLQGSQAGVPANLSLMYPTGNRTWGESGNGGYMGAAHSPMQLVQKNPNAKAQSLALEGISLDRLNDRNRLRGAIDKFRATADSTGQQSDLDAYNAQALGILSNNGLMNALDVSKENPRIAERYGVNDSRYQRDGAPRMIRNFLIARRLVEAGARVVSLNYSRWDWHGGDGMNFPRSRQEMPLLDQGLSALLTDLKERGLNKDVAVVMWGEFGRTPKINKNNSRDHWPRANFAFMAGGGMNHGQIIGSTDKHGNEPNDRPVKFQEVFATLYNCLGINTETATVTDTQGRPHYLVDSGIKPIRELVG
ncbi:MAG: DUF1501 domain-containing protein [Verrucomicrobiota bacterium]|jgi:hypothetical protein|nr:DUF1501 domain-containing protein [Verrucomicrobiota bacterium]MDG1833488.1 DUF1501 domain-containing protein [Verrucomicrobiota bacterium]